MSKFVNEVIIDDHRIHTLTMYASSKGSKKNIVSDHNILFSKFSIELISEPTKVRNEFFNFKNTKNQMKFFKKANSSNRLTKIFNINNNFKQKTKKILKRAE